MIEIIAWLLSIAPYLIAILSAVSLLVTLPLILLIELLPQPIWRTTAVRQATLASAALLAFLGTYLLLAWALVKFTVEMNSLLESVTSPYKSIDQAITTPELWYRALLPPRGRLCYTQNITACESVNRGASGIKGDREDWVLYLARLGSSGFAALVAWGIIHRKLYAKRNRSGQLSDCAPTRN